MPKSNETWYDGQANAAKLITYAALLVLLASIGWAAYSAWQTHNADQATLQTIQALTPPATSGSAPVVQFRQSDYHAAMFSVIAGIALSAFLYGIAAIIDLLIVGCEALRSR